MPAGTFLVARNPEPGSRLPYLIRLPLPGGFLGACTSRSWAPSMAFAVNSAARHPLVSFAGLASRGCRIRLMLRAGQSLPHKGFRRCASTLGVSPQRRQPATGPAGSYPDRTFTGWRAPAYAWVSSFLTSSLPVPHAAGHTNTRLATYGRAVAVALVCGSWPCWLLGRQRTASGGAQPAALGSPPDIR